MIATARIQPASARSIFTGKHGKVNYMAYNNARLCGFSL